MLLQKIAGENDKVTRTICRQGGIKARTMLLGSHLENMTDVAITNLPLRKRVGIDSCGVLISAVHSEEGKEGLNLLMLSGRIPAGAKMYEAPTLKYPACMAPGTLAVPGAFLRVWPPAAYIRTQPSALG